MARPIEKEGTGKHADHRAFISERARDLATMYLTRRKDLEVRFPASVDMGLDCIVEVSGKHKLGRRVFGIQLKGAMSPVTNGQANKALRSVVERLRADRRYPFPVGLLYFTMANNEGRFIWIAEPRIKNGRPMLHYNEAPQAKILDSATLDQLVDKVNQWFDAVPADEGDAACGTCGTVLYGESAKAGKDRVPCPCCGSTARSFTVRVSTRANVSSRERAGHAKRI